ncbi:alpha/beta hydrolase [Coprobacter secundus]|jgi:hypothetical protein|nr:alpha/beta hydrolase family protein [Coprobacter secundus]
MKKIILSRVLSMWCLILFLPGMACAQSYLSENKSMKSNILKEDVKYSIYLPKSYQTSEKSYPVLYLLHGLGDNHTSWSLLGQIQAIADRVIDSGKADEMIIVMPDAKQSWYINACKGKAQMEKMFFEEFIPHIETTYRAISQKEQRAIAGLSMGGYGSLLYALKHPDMFVACFPISAAVFSDEDILNFSEEDYTRRFKDIIGGGNTKESRLTPTWRENDIYTILKNYPKADKKKVKYYIACGDDDFLYRNNLQLALAMYDTHIPTIFRLRNGQHHWPFWRREIKEILHTASSHFHRGEDF